VDFHVLFRTAEGIDSWLTGLFSGAPLLVALGIALLLGLRHASDPDHLVAVTSIVAADHGNTRAAARLGVWWGVGHAGMLIVVGLPLILLKSELPAWLESGAEKAVGGVILLLAGRVIAKWVRGDFRLSAHSHTPVETDTLHDAAYRHLRRGSGTAHHHRHVRTRRQALAIGILHGLAGTGAVVLLLIAALPTQVEAVAALAIFAPASIVSMTVCTSAFAWVLTRPVIEPVYRAILIPALGVFGMIFGGWYVGLL
jgi:high-affinity nickel permease